MRYLAVLLLLAAGADAAHRGGGRGVFAGPGWRGGHYGGFRGSVGGGFQGARWGVGGYWGGFSRNHTYYGYGASWPVYPYAPLLTYPTFSSGYAPAPNVYAPQAPNVIVIQAPPAQQSAPVVVYDPQPSAPAVLRQAPRSWRESGTPIYLLAMKDGTIWAALSYWVQAGRLHYITRNEEHKQVALDALDRPFSERLNDERGVDFRLP